MEILAEILLDVYGELMLLIVPEKGTSKKIILLSKIFAILVLMGGIALVLWGIYLIADQDNLLGILPITLAVIISLAQIIAGIVLYKKNH